MNEMYKYLLNHNYISENKTSDSQKELSVERAECIANKFNSLIEEKENKLNEIFKKISAMSDEFELYQYVKDFDKKINAILKILEEENK